MGNRAKKTGILLWVVIMLISCNEQDPPCNCDQFPAGRAISIFVDPENVVWVGSDQGLCSYYLGRWKLHDETEGPNSKEILDLVPGFPNPGAELWYGSKEGAGRFHYSEDQVEATEWYTSSSSPLLDNHVGALAVDLNSAIWMATPLGLNILHQDVWYEELNRGLLERYPVLCLASMKNGWVLGGTNGFGVARHHFDPDVDGITGASYYNEDWSGLQSDTILSIYVEENDHQWYGTTKGLAYHQSFDTQLNWTSYTIKNGLIHNRIQSVCGDKNGNIWVGTPEGISMFDGESWINYTISDGLVHNDVNDIAIGPDGAIWIATEGGVSLFDGAVWQNFKVIKQ